MAQFRLLLLCVGVLFITTSPTTSADESAIPYIYYYANTANAIVVERADGTDSRLIAPGVMPLNQSFISDLNWSPSGEWMAWRSATAIETYPNKYKGWIASSDGSQRLTLLDDLYGDILTMEWSPTSDLLFVVHTVERRNFKLMIIDPAANKIIAHTLYESQNIILRDYETNSGWLANGEEVYFGAQVYPSYLIARLTITNVVRTVMFRDGYPFNGEYYQSQVINLQNGRLFYFDYNESTSKLEVVLEDLLIEKKILINPDSNAQTNYQVFWNPHMSYALIVTSDCSTNPCSPKSLSLLDWDAGTLTRFDSHLDTLNTQYELWREPKIWSPDGRYLLLIDTNTHKYAVLDVITGEINSLITPNGILYWEWSDANVLYLVGGENRVTYRYDIVNNQMRSLPMLPLKAYYSLSPAPDGNHVGIYESQRGSVINIDTNQRFTWPPHSLGINGGIWGSYIWHPDGQWFFSREHISFAGGGGGPEALMIVNMEGTTRRELGVCFCDLGFVPDRALPHLGEGSPTSVIQQPEYTLPHDDKVTAVAWSPDGNKLASYTLNPVYNSGGKLTIWEMNGTPELLTTYNVEMDCDQRLSFCRVAWSRDGRTIKLNNGTTLEIWDIESNEHRLTNVQKSTLCEAYEFLSPDGLLIACKGDIDDTTGISIVDTTSGLTLETIEPEWGVIGWSSDSKTLFLGNNLSQIQLWDSGKTQILNTPNGIDSVDVHPRNRFIVGASLYHRIFVWDAETGERLPDINWYATAVALSPDGTRLAAAGSSLVTIWDTSEFAP